MNLTLVLNFTRKHVFPPNLASYFSARLASPFKQPLKKPVQIFCFRMVCSGENERCSLFNQYGKGYQYGDFISFMASRAAHITQIP